MDQDDRTAEWRAVGEVSALGLSNGCVVPVRTDLGTVGLLIAGSTRPGWETTLRPLLETTASLLSAAARHERTASTQQRLLTTDPDTGLANAAGMLPWLDPTSAAPGDLALVRIQTVEDIHTAYGPRQARSFLLACAQALQQSLDAPVARTAANELGLVVHGVASARRVGEQVARTLAAPVTISDGLHAIADTAVGVVRVGPGEHPATALASARAALSAAARRPQHRVEVYERRFVTDTASALGQAVALEEAVRDGQLSIHVQPGRRFTERAPRWAEILVRFDSPDLAGVPVGELVANAERSGAVTRLGTQVMRHAAALDQRLRRGGLGLDLLSINLSVLQLQETSLADELAAIVRSAGGSPDSFAVELTESVAMSDARPARAVLEALGAQGFRIVIDDFGAGSIAMHRLLDLPFDVLKIDRSLLRGTTEDAARRTVLASAIRLGLDLDKLVIVAGVETQAQLAMVRDMGADVAQGFCVARPQPPELGVLELADWGLWRP